MQQGIYLPNFGPFGEARVVADWAVCAEDAGWDGLFLWDHLARPLELDVVDPWIALAAIAVATSRIRLGALVTPLPRRRPWKFAREVASLDRLCEGRLVAGVGLGSQGGSEVEWAAFGEETDLRRRAGMLDEALELVVSLWSGETVSYEGAHYQMAPTRFTPTPIQRPLPVWVAGYWPRKAPMRRAARYQGAFPLLAADLSPDEAVASMTACIRFLREERGTLADFDVVHLAAPTAPGEGALQDAFRAVGVTWWLERICPDEFGADWTEPWPLDAMRAHVERGPEGQS